MSKNKELRIIIAGGRDFDDYPLLRKESLRIVKEVVMKTTGNSVIQKDLVTIVSGAAKGADTLGEQFSREFNLALRQFQANWDRYGRRAGYMRNTDMAKFVAESNVHGVLIAFWDGQSKGTKHMIDTARKMRIETYVVSY